MAIKNYSVTLEEDIVKRCQQQSKAYGGKLSPLINKLLLEWCEKQERK